MSARYCYADAHDQITLRFIEQAEPYAGYWSSSEQRTLDLATRRLRDVLGARTAVRALDAGCGEGRQLSWLSRLAARITAVDPDPGRLDMARQRATELLPGTDIDVKTTPIQDLSSGPFDLVVCSHVIQHVRTADLVPILRRLRDLVGPGGCLLLSYSRGRVAGERFSVDRLEQGEVHSHPLDRDGFDAALGAGDGLPIRYFDPVELAARALEIGWVESWTWTYHVLDDLGVLDCYVDRDELVNSVPALWRQLGRDMLVLWRPRTS